MKSRFGAIAVFLVMFCHALAAGSLLWAAGEAQTGVTFADGMLSVSVNNVALGSLLDEIAAKTKIKVNVADEVKGVRVSSRYVGIPVKDGLIRILDEAGLSSYLLVYGDRERQTVKELFVMKGDKTTSGSATTPAGRAPGQTMPRHGEMPGARMSPSVPPMVPIPMPPPMTGESPEPPPLPPVPENDEIPQPPPPIPVPPAEMTEVPPPPPVLP